MKLLTPYLLALGIVAATSPSHAATILSQNFDTDPVNYVLVPGSEFIQMGDPAVGTSIKYWDLSSNLGALLNPNITGNATTYLTGQNMDPVLPFNTGAPAQVDFSVNVTGFTDLRFSIDLAGLLMPEPENYVRAFTDDDNDGFFETPIFGFFGTGNLPYTETTTGQQLTAAFQTFGNLPLNFPTAADRILRVRLEMFNDTDTQTEAIGIDNIVISGIPEPSTSLLALTGLLALARRRRRE